MTTRTSRSKTAVVHYESSDNESDLTELERESESELSQDEGDSNDSEYGAGKKSMRRAPKRQKKVHATVDMKAAQPTGVKRTRKSLSMLPDMPLDVLFEILALLSPADLLRVARTTKSFRRLLLSKKTLSIWKQSRKRLDDTEGSECPSDLSEPQWASLIWGGNECQECGTKPVLKIQFSLRRRVCVRCMKEHLVKAPDFPKRYPDYDEEIMSLIPYSNVGAWAHGTASNTKYFWDDDIINMGPRLGAYVKAVRMGQRNARSELEGFRTRCTESVFCILLHAPKAVAWYNRFSMDQYLKNDQVRAKRLDDMKTRLLHDGWEEQDIDKVLWARPERTPKPLTEAGWKRVLPGIVKNLAAAKAERLARELQMTISQRRKVLLSLYKTILADQPPADALFFPNLDVICEFSSLEPLINAPVGVDVAAELASALEDPQFLVKIEESLNSDPRKTLLAENISRTVAKYLTSAAEQGGFEELASISVDSACAVFRCKKGWSPSVCCGIKEVVWHEHMPSFMSIAEDLIPNRIVCVSFEVRAAQAVLAVLKLLGMPINTGCEVLDARQAWFTCDHCPSKADLPNRWGKCVMTWRQAMYHHVSLTASEQHDRPPSFTLLSPHDMTAEEKTDPRDGLRGWYCMHCSQFLVANAAKPFGYGDSCLRKTEIVRHVSETHNIDEVVVDHDFKWHGRFSSEFSVLNPIIPKAAPPAPIAGEKDSIWRCLRCSAASQRRFILAGVKDHLKAKHQKQNPVLDEDYRKT